MNRTRSRWFLELVCPSRETTKEDDELATRHSVGSPFLIVADALDGSSAVVNTDSREVLGGGNAAARLRQAGGFMDLVRELKSETLPLLPPGD